MRHGLRGDWAMAWLAGRPKSGTWGTDGKQAAAALRGTEGDGPAASRREGNEAGEKDLGQAETTGLNIERGGERSKEIIFLIFFILKPNSNMN